MQIAKKILIVRFSSIGDIVLTSPIIRTIKEQLGAEIHFLTKKQFSYLLTDHPQVDKLWLLDGRLGDLLPRLQAEHFDCLVDLHKNLRTLRLRLQLGIPYYSFDKLNLAKWLMVRFKVNRLPAVHLVDRYFAGLKALGISNDGKGLDFFIPEKEEVSIASAFPGIRNYVVLVIGATYYTKRIPEENLLAICASLPEAIIIVGGPDEAALGDRLAATQAQVINAAGKYSLMGSASIIRQADRVITSDTGLMHIAAAYQKKIISLWGNTIPDFGMYPYYKKNVYLNQCLEIKGLSCRPCSKIGYDACPKGHFACMKQIKITNLLAAIEKQDGAIQS